MKAWRLSVVAVPTVLAVLAVSFAGAYPHRHEDPCCEHQPIQACEVPGGHGGEASLQHVVSYVNHGTCHVCFFKKLTSGSHIESFERCPVPPDTDAAVVPGISSFTATGRSFVESRAPPVL